ncbi:GNAT family N-acetyltransferase [Halobacillus seohaensis]|uniref:GNAT family N-acetyltransferase n=1 Tax=Halobacillus seohaensis TaxID=447421 RepID=A0ABW2EHT2_9BACI
MKIRHIKPKDAKAFSKLTAQVEKEADYMLMEPGERSVSEEQQRSKIESILQETQSTILIAEINNEIVGYLVAMGTTVRRIKHTVYVAIGILADFQGKGIGTELFHELNVWAKEQGIHRLELTTAIENDRGYNLYKKAGFEIEGRKRDSLKINGKYVDEYYMAKILEDKI